MIGLCRRAWYILKVVASRLHRFAFDDELLTSGGNGFRCCALLMQQKGGRYAHFHDFQDGSLFRD